MRKIQKRERAGVREREGNRKCCGCTGCRPDIGGRQTYSSCTATLAEVKTGSDTNTQLHTDTQLHPYTDTHKHRNIQIYHYIDRPYTYKQITDRPIDLIYLPGHYSNIGLVEVPVQVKVGSMSMAASH